MNSIMEQIKFVILQYPDINILINECQLSAGVQLEEERTIPPVSVFIHSLITFNFQNIAVLDFDKYLELHFGIASDRTKNTALIADLTQLHTSTVNMLDKALEKVDGIDKPLRYLAVKVNKPMESIYIDLNEIKLLPELVQESCAVHGVIGTCFLEGKGNSYLIDFNNLIADMIAAGRKNE